MAVLLKTGAVGEREEALVQLVAAGAELELAECLATGDPLAAHLASSGLWECWLNEEGPQARQEMETGIALMNEKEFAGAEKFFRELHQRFPKWAEALNKLATLLYLRGQAALSLPLCEKVISLKPHHFGAWNGLALCAVQLEDWPTALQAARRALQLQPAAAGNEEIIQLAREMLDEAPE